MSDSKLYSISDLAKEFSLDRATVNKRLGDFPHERGAKNSKLYVLEDVAPLLGEGSDSPELANAKLRKALAEAEKVELLVKKLKGELVNRVEVLTEVQEIIAGLYQKICVQYVRRNAGRLHKQKTSQDLAQVLQKELMQVFEDLADEYSFTTSDSGGNTP